ncbi:hypothetical protein EDD90_10685 [Streptomyces sp. Ag109_O5-1]|nr:hypothetical protein EDD90_10685 [Streptomyces sp. Ag109_O5-1]
MSETARKASAAPSGEANRWRALVFIALAQLMVVLDATIVNIALPSAQADLGISDGNRLGVPTPLRTPNRMRQLALECWCLMGC